MPSGFSRVAARISLPKRTSASTLATTSRWGDDVFSNRGVFLDSKGGISIGNRCALAEGAEIYTPSHSQSDYVKRTYAGVTIKDFACIYSHAAILPGITIGAQAIVAAGERQVHCRKFHTMLRNIRHDSCNTNMRNQQYSEFIANITLPVNGTVLDYRFVL